MKATDLPLGTWIRYRDRRAFTYAQVVAASDGGGALVVAGDQPPSHVAEVVECVRARDGLEARGTARVSRFSTPAERLRLSLRARASLFGGLYRCPTTGRVIASLPGDDKVLCSCGRSNPAVVQEQTERTGTHIVRFLTSVDVGEFVEQEAKKIEEEQR